MNNQYRVYALFFILGLIISFPSAWGSERLKTIVLSAPDNYYVVQVSSFAVDTDLSQPQKELLIDRSLVAVKTLTKDKEQRWSILSGIFPNRKEATRHALVLEKNYPNLSPWVRSVKSLRDALVSDKR